MIKGIWLKEIKAELYTWKSMAWLLIASLLLSFTSYLLLTNKELSLLDQTELLWLLAKIIIGVGFLIVAIDASSLITSEFEKETAESLFLSPIGLKNFILGKLYAALTLWLLIYIVSIPYIIVASAGSRLAFAFAAYVLLLGSLGIIGFSLFIFAVSLLYRSSKNTLTTSLILLLVMAIPALFASNLKTNSFASFLSSINPLDNIFSSLDNVLVDYQLNLTQNWQFIVPIIIFCGITACLLFYSLKVFKKRGVIHQDI
jgi:ABC-2 type transport system permease protein